VGEGGTKGKHVRQGAHLGVVTCNNVCVCVKKKAKTKRERVHLE